MDSILEQLWNGEIDPSAREFCKGSEYHELLQLLGRNQDRLLETLNDSEKELFQKYKDCKDEMDDIETREVFISGFQSGVKVILEIAGDKLIN